MDLFPLRSDEPIPDPIKIVQRIKALEETVANVQAEVNDITTQKKQLVLDTYQILSNNASRIQNVGDYETNLPEFCKQNNLGIVS